MIKQLRPTVSENNNRTHLIPFSTLGSAFNFGTFLVCFHLLEAHLSVSAKWRCERSRRGASAGYKKSEPLADQNGLIRHCLATSLMVDVTWCFWCLMVSAVDVWCWLVQIDYTELIHLPELQGVKGAASEPLELPSLLATQAKRMATKAIGLADGSLNFQSIWWTSAVQLKRSLRFQHRQHHRSGAKTFASNLQQFHHGVHTSGTFLQGLLWSHQFLGITVWLNTSNTRHVHLVDIKLCNWFILYSYIYIYI